MRRLVLLFDCKGQRGIQSSRVTVVGRQQNLPKHCSNPECTRLGADQNAIFAND